MATNTTITFSTTGTTESITIETDNERNSGKSSFSYGETAYFRVYSANPESLSVVSTAGTIEYAGVYVSDRDAENIQFVDSAEYEYQYPIEAVTAYIWYGQSLGQIAKTGTAKIASEITPDAANGIIGLASVTVSAKYALYSITLATQPESEFPVLVDVR